MLTTVVDLYLAYISYENRSSPALHSVFVPYNLSLKDNRDAREPLWDLFNIALFRN